MEGSEPRDGERSNSVAQAEASFRAALLQSHRTRRSVGDLESAAAKFCGELRRQGLLPEQMLKSAKRVIDETIDGNDVVVAEQAVRMCIQHYFRTD